MDKQRSDECGPFIPNSLSADQIINGHSSVELVETERIQRAAAYIKSRLTSNDLVPSIGVICGSGLAGLATAMESAIVIPYEEIPGFPLVTVVGHGNKLLVGLIAGVSTIIMLGRFHYYEGHSLAQVVFPVRVMAKLGVTVLLVTNSAGALNPNLKVGDLLVIEDHISFLNLAGINPLRGPNLSSMGSRFPSLTHAYHPLSYELVSKAAIKAGVPPDRIRRGIYIMVGGPTYETPAEVRFLGQVGGGDVVGMSSIPEVVTAVHCGMKVVAFSLVSNICVDTKISSNFPKHEEVLAVTDSYAIHLNGLITNLIPFLLT